MNLIKLECVCKRFGEKNLFNNLSMEIEQGEFVSIMGESGAGKTTLLISLECWNLPIGEM